jgi:hypothetical protein
MEHLSSLRSPLSLWGHLVSPFSPLSPSSCPTWHISWHTDDGLLLCPLARMSPSPHIASRQTACKHRPLRVLCQSRTIAGSLLSTRRKAKPLCLAGKFLKLPAGHLPSCSFQKPNQKVPVCMCSLSRCHGSCCPLLETPLPTMCSPAVSSLWPRTEWDPVQTGSSP